MSTSLRQLNKVLIAAGAIAVSVTFGQNCGRFEAVHLSSSGVANSGLDSPEPLMPVALFSSEQLLKSMISATGTEGLGELDNPADDMIRQVYSDRSGSLPSGQDLKLITGPTMISITNLASAVCAKAVDRDRSLGEAQKQDRLFFRELDFSKGVQAQSSDGIELAVARLALNAWRRDATDEELAAFSQFGNEFAAQAAANDIQATRTLAIAVCTAVLSSFDAVTY